MHSPASRTCREGKCSAAPKDRATSVPARNAACNKGLQPAAAAAAYGLVTPARFCADLLHANGCALAPVKSAARNTRQSKHLDAGRPAAVEIGTPIAEDRTRILQRAQKGG